MIAIEDKKFLDAVRDMSKVSSSPVKAMLEVLLSEQGYNIALYNLEVGRLDDGKFFVSDEDYDPCDDEEEEEYIFESVTCALDKFFELRAKKEVGMDYEALK